MDIFASVLQVLSTSFNGVDHSIPGNGGWDCYSFLTLKQRIVDTCVFTAFVIIIILPTVIKRISLPTESDIKNSCVKRTSQNIVGTRRILLIGLCLIFGIEIQ